MQFYPSTPNIVNKINQFAKDSLFLICMMHFIPLVFLANNPPNQEELLQKAVIKGDEKFKK